MKSVIQMYVLLELNPLCIYLSLKHIQECPDGAHDFRDIQCAATDNVLFDGKFHSWESFNGQCM